MTHPNCIKKLVEEFKSRSPMRAPSLISTVFGDVVTQHGGLLWLGSLVNALALLDVDERLVRTSVFRLVKDGWLKSHKRGRRSYYQLTTYGLHEYQRAAHRIYDLEKPKWNENWQLVLLRDIPDEKRDLFRRSLYWQGFRQVSTGVLARPKANNRKLLETIEEFGLETKLLLLNATAESFIPHQVIQDLVEECWELDKVAGKYRDFIKHYRTLHKWLNSNSPEPDSAFIARTLLIHDFRRILLQDTPLPQKLLPAEWPGSEALNLTSEIYQRLALPSIDYITTHFENDVGMVPGPKGEFYDRFNPTSKAKN